MVARKCWTEMCPSVPGFRSLSSRVDKSTASVATSAPSKTILYYNYNKEPPNPYSSYLVIKALNLNIARSTGSQREAKCQRAAASSFFGTTFQVLEKGPMAFPLGAPQSESKSLKFSKNGGKKKAAGPASTQCMKSSRSISGSEWRPASQRSRASKERSSFRQYSRSSWRQETHTRARCL